MVHTILTSDWSSSSVGPVAGEASSCGGGGVVTRARKRLLDTGDCRGDTKAAPATKRAKTVAKVAAKRRAKVTRGRRTKERERVAEAAEKTADPSSSGSSDSSSGEGVERISYTEWEAQVILACDWST